MEVNDWKEIIESEVDDAYIQIWYQAEKMGIERTQESWDWLMKIFLGVTDSEFINKRLRCDKPITEDGKRLIQESEKRAKENKEYQAATNNERSIALIFGSLDTCLSQIKIDNPKHIIGLLCKVNVMLGMLTQSIDPSEIKKSMSEMFSHLGAKGADIRHTPMRTLKDWTLTQYQAGKWTSANKAAHDLKEKVMEHGRTINAILTKENAQRTIADWINKSV